MRKTLLLVILFLALVGLIIFISTYFLGTRTSFFGKATGGVGTGTLSLQNSYLFASPLIASAQNQEKIRVTIFILDDKGLGISGKKVSLQTDQGISVEEVQAVTDGYGKAVFDISAGNPGEYLVEGIVESSSLPQKVKVTFN